MTKPTQILVPTDFSQPSDAAQLYATMLADAFEATLHLLHVIPDPLDLGWAVDAADLPQLLERTERAVHERLQKGVTPGLGQKHPTRIAVDTGAPASKILEYASQHGIDLIVMGTRGRGTVERVWVGSVTQGVLHHATCPVVSIQQPRT